MPGKGFLVRGTLMPNMGSVTGYKQQVTHSQSFPKRQAVVVPSSSATSRSNRIPSSIAIRRRNGV